MPFDLHETATRSKVIIERTEAALSNSLTVPKFATRVAELYLQRVPALHRVVKFVKMDGSTDDLLAAERRNFEIVLHLIKGTTRFPADIEESWIDALPEPYRKDLIRELAQRVGLIGARQAELSADDHAANLADVLADAGRIAQALAQAYADGKLTREDAPACQRALPIVARGIADLASLQVQLQAVVAAASSVVPLRSAG